jgi:hypothetical protein
MSRNCNRAAYVGFEPGQDNFSVRLQYQQTSGVSSMVTYTQASSTVDSRKDDG